MEEEEEEGKKGITIGKEGQVPREEKVEKRMAAGSDSLLPRGGRVTRRMGPSSMVPVAASNKLFSPCISLSIHR